MHIESRVNAWIFHLIKNIDIFYKIPGKFCIANILWKYWSISSQTNKKSVSSHFSSSKMHEGIKHHTCIFTHAFPLSVVCRFWNKNELHAEPDNNESERPEGEDCVVVNSFDQTWYDVPCFFSYPRVCQKADTPLWWGPQHHHGATTQTIQRADALLRNVSGKCTNKLLIKLIKVSCSVDILWLFANNIIVFTVHKEAYQLQKYI